VGKSEEYQTNELALVKTCDLCGNDKLKLEFEVDGCTLLKCSKCGLVFTSPRCKEEYLLAMYRDEFYEKAPSYLSAQLQQPAEDLYRLALSIRRILGPEKSGGAVRSLDVGSGAGNAVAAFKKAGWTAVGIDLSETATKVGKDLGLDLRTTDIAEVEPSSFDVVTAFHVLEHVSSPMVFLGHCITCLAPKGILVIEVPNYGCRNACNLREHWPNLYPRHHLYQFTASTLKAYLLRLNLEAIAMSKLSGYGPAEDYSSVPRSGLQPRSRIKRMLQESRHTLFLIPGARPFLRWILWQALGYGEFIRVLCRKKS
jgi:2-polyprenyl-3-methyl-5-hydroxy-6-metoxy-1,4-benzoquinol methylase